MSESLFIFSGAIILIVALSLDAFAAGVAYGSDHIRVPWQSAFLISLVGSLFLAISLFLGTWIQTQVASDTAKWISAMCLLSLGIFKLLDYRVKTYINHHQNMQKDIRFSISRLKFLITIYGDPTAADEDESRSLSLREAFVVAAAMSLDSLVAGVGASDWQVPILPVAALAFGVGTLGVLSGCWIGQRLVQLKDWDISWISGLILVGLAFVKWI